MKNSFRVPFRSALFFLVLFLVGGLHLLPVNGLAGESLPHLISNKAFTAGDQEVAMPDAWLKKSITYQKIPQPTDIVLVLDQDVYHTLRPFIARYGEINKLRILPIDGTCGMAAGMLAKKAIDIGGFCCPPGKEDRLPGLRYHTLGIVAKAILVHPENPVDTLTIDQTRDIFSGKIANWSEIKDAKKEPGPSLAIRTIGRFHCKARPGHWYHILPDEKMFSPLLNEVGSIPDMITQVSASHGSIGWEVLSMTERYKNLGQVKPLKINGFAPTDREALIAGRYPLYRTYNLTTWEGKETANQHAQGLVEYIKKEIEQLDSRFGFVPASALRKAGWQFKGDELTGEPPAAPPADKKKGTKKHR